MKTFDSYFGMMERWGSTGLLQSCKNKTAVLALEGQMELNNFAGNPFEAQFKTASLPLMRRIFGALPESKIQGTTDPTSELHEFNVKFKYAATYEFVPTLDEQAAYNAELAAALVKEIEQLTESGPIAIKGLLVDRFDPEKITLHYNRI